MHSNILSLSFSRVLFLFCSLFCREKAFIVINDINFRLDNLPAGSSVVFQPLWRSRAYDYTWRSTLIEFSIFLFASYFLNCLVMASQTWYGLETKRMWDIARFGTLGNYVFLAVILQSFHTFLFVVYIIHGFVGISAAMAGLSTKLCIVLFTNCKRNSKFVARAYV